MEMTLNYKDIPFTLGYQTCNIQVSTTSYASHSQSFHQTKSELQEIVYIKCKSFETKSVHKPRVY